MTRLGRPTGRRPAFSRQDVVDAALEIGVNDFTLTAVAQRLGVAPSALYRTIDSREGLMRACLAELATRLRFQPDPVSWRRNAHNQADALWTLLESAHGLDQLLLTVPWSAEYFAGTVTAAHDAFVASGMSPQDAALAVDTISDTVISAHVSVAALRSSWNGDPAAPAGFARLPAAFEPDASWLERGWLDRKIELILDGLQARRTPRP